MGSGQAQAERQALGGAGLGQGAGPAGRAAAVEGMPSALPLEDVLSKECEGPAMPPGIPASLCVGMVVPFRTVSQRGSSGNAGEGGGGGSRVLERGRAARGRERSGAGRSGAGRGRAGQKWLAS